MQSAVDGCVDLLLPPRCAACSALTLREPAPASPLCDACRSALAADEAQAAPRGLDALVSGAAYSGPVVTWIQGFKYPNTGIAGLEGGSIAIVIWLALEAARGLPGPKPELVVPVPLHPRRLRARGFNPAALLARAIAREHGLRYAPHALQRRRDTASQTRLSISARRRNVAGAFVATAEPGGTIWLVDDVATTGATLAECARTLRRAGAKQVLGICAARTPKAS